MARAGLDRVEQHATYHLWSRRRGLEHVEVLLAAADVMTGAGISLASGSCGIGKIICVVYYDPLRVVEIFEGDAEEREVAHQLCAGN